jgi:hypothetical protein
VRGGGPRQAPAEARSTIFLGSLTLTDLVPCVRPGTFKSSTGQESSSRRGSRSLKRARKRKFSSQTLKTSSSSNNISRRVHICVYMCIQVPSPCSRNNRTGKVPVLSASKCPRVSCKSPDEQNASCSSVTDWSFATRVSDLCICSPPDSHHLSLTFRFSSPTWSVPYTPRIQHSSILHASTRVLAHVVPLYAPA